MAHAIEALRMRVPQLTLTGALALALAARGNSNNSSGAAGTSASANTAASVVPKPAAISAKNSVSPALSKVGSVLITTTRTSSTNPAFTNDSTILFYSNDGNGTFVEIGNVTNNAVGGFKIATKTVPCSNFWRLSR